MAYGARLESVLGASPRGFESPILRHSRLTKHSGKFSGSISHFADVDEDYSLAAKDLDIAAIPASMRLL